MRADPAPEGWPVEWDAPPGVGAWMSTRRGGTSRPPYDSLNLRPAGLPGEADDPECIAENQRRFRQAIGAVPVFLNQVHGARVVRIGRVDAVPSQSLPEADASVCTDPGVACTVLVADCLPVLFASADGRAVAAAHAGWRGLAAGVLESTVSAVCDAAGCEPAAVVAWLGPCIGPRQFEVGADVLAAFGVVEPLAADRGRFVPRMHADGRMRWLADLPALARERLACAGVHCVSGTPACTVEDASRFFSFRRDGRTGRLAAAVWRRDGH